MTGCAQAMKARPRGRSMDRVGNFCRWVPFSPFLLRWLIVRREGGQTRWADRRRATCGADKIFRCHAGPARLKRIAAGARVCGNDGERSGSKGLQSEIQRRRLEASWRQSGTEWRQSNTDWRQSAARWRQSPADWRHAAACGRRLEVNWRQSKSEGRRLELEWR